MSFFYSDSKTDLKLWCVYCKKTPAVQGCPRHFF